MPSFLKSTLSIAFIICVLSVIVMIFLGIKPEDTTFAIITAIISAYLTNYGRSKEKDDGKGETVSNNEDLDFISQKYDHNN